MVKNSPAMHKTWVQSLGREDPLEKEMATHSSILAWRIPWMENLLDGESHGRRSLVGYSPRGHKESDTTEQLHFVEDLTDLKRPPQGFPVKKQLKA